MKINIKKINPKKGDILFVTCDDANSTDMQVIEEELRKKIPNITAVVTNYPLKVKKVNILGVPYLKVECEGTFTYENLHDLEYLVMDSMVTEGALPLESNKEICKSSIKTGSKDRYALLKKDNSKNVEEK
jgi:hypothetical protein